MNTNEKTKGMAAVLLLILLATAGMAAFAADASPLTLADAKAIALEQARLAEEDVFITKLKADDEGGRQTLEVAFVAGDMAYEYELYAADGAVRKSSTEEVGRKWRNIDASGYIGFDRALEAALADAGFAADAVGITEMQFDFDDGRAEYEITFIADGTEYEYELDATSGEVLRRETERAKRK